MKIMQKFTVPCVTLISLLFFSQNIFSKTLPDNMFFTSDSRQLMTRAQPASGLYDINTIKTIYLTFEQADWWQKLTSNFEKGIDLPATLMYEGETLTNVGIRFRGETSYMFTKNSQKKSFNVSIDYIDSNQRLMGYKTLNLNNCYSDPSFIREILFSALIGEHIPVYKANFVKLVINGENWGVYSSVQQLNKDFYKNWFFDKDGTSWRAKFPDTSTAKKPGQPGFGAGYCSMNYLGNNFMTYTRYYTLKSYSKDNPWDDLIKTCDKLNNLPVNLLYDSLQYYLDVDRALWTIAMEIAFTDEDGYVHKGGSDYYIYFDPETNRIQPIEYDGNSTFIIRNGTWTPFHKEQDAKYPLINRLLSNPVLRQRYIAHIRTIARNLLNENKTNALIDMYKGIIDEEVKSDTKKLYNYNQFNTAINEIKTFIKNRRNNLLNNMSVAAEAPKISDVKYFSADGMFVAPFPDQTVSIQAKVSSSIGISKVLLYYGTGLSGTFKTVEMFDDGYHDDVNANDGIYAAAIEKFPAGTYVRYYIEARSANSYQSASFEPEGAEHDVYIYQVRSKVEENSDIVINEFMASNSKTIADPQGQYDDWIELFNKGNSDVNLGGMYLSDKIDNPKKWKFPEDIIIKTGEYLIVWADDDVNDTPGIHTNFKISADGEVILLVNRDDKGNSIMDSISFGPQERDISYGRYPNGTGRFYKMNPTPGAYNDNTLSVENYQDIAALQINSLYPNPFTHNTSLDISIAQLCRVRIAVYDVLGEAIQIIADTELSEGDYNFLWDGCNHYGIKSPAGVYYIRIDTDKTSETRLVVLY